MAVASECPTVGTLFVLVLPFFNVCTGPGTHCHSPSLLLSLLRSQNRQTDKCWYCSLLVFFFSKDGSDWMMIQVSCCRCTFLCIVCLQRLIVSLSSLVVLAISPAISFAIWHTHKLYDKKKKRLLTHQKKKKATHSSKKKKKKKWLLTHRVLFSCPASLTVVQLEAIKPRKKKTGRQLNASSSFLPNSHASPTNGGEFD